MSENKKINTESLRSFIATRVKEMPIPSVGSPQKEEDSLELMAETLSKMALTLNNLDKRLTEMERNWSSLKEVEASPEINTLLEDN